MEFNGVKEEGEDEVEGFKNCNFDLNLEFWFDLDVLFNDCILVEVWCVVFWDVVICWRRGKFEVIFLFLILWSFCFVSCCVVDFYMLVIG